MQTCRQRIEANIFFIRKIFIKKYIIDLIQKRNYTNIAKIR